MGATYTKRDHGKFRSGLEAKFALVLEDNRIVYGYEELKLDYTIPESKHKYYVDFLVNDLIIETKGRLTTVDRKKMLAVKFCNPTRRIVFVFENANKKLRKGSNTSYADWCTKNNFEFYTLKQIKENPACLFPTTQKVKPSSLKTPRTKKPKS